MRIVSVNYNYSPEFTSPESWLKRTARYRGSLEVLAENHEVIFIKQISWSGKISHNGIEHYFTNFGANKLLFSYRINRLVKRLKPDVVLLQGLHHPLEFIHLYYLLPKQTRIIAQHHAEKPSKTLKRYAQKFANRLIDAYLFSSASLGGEWVIEGIISNTSKIHEIMEMSSLFSPVGKIKALAITKASGQPIFLWVGRLNDNKDPLNVVCAFLRFAEEHPAAKLYMIYQTEELLPRIKDLLNGHPKKDSIVLVGKINNNEVLYWHNSADFYLSGSHYEGSGTALCEAMSCGCIPVVTDIPSFNMITNKGDCGILYEPGNEDALVSALRQTQTIDHGTYRKKCLDRFNEKLSFKAIARDIEAVANSIIK